MADPDVFSKPDTFRELSKEYKNLTPIIEKFREYKRAEDSMQEASAWINDPTADGEMKSLAEEEYRLQKELLSRLEGELRVLLLPRNPDDDRNVVVEIRSGAGGEEAALFVAVLYRMYSMYVQSAGFRMDLLNANPTELGGYKEVSFLISGDGAYSRFKFESGVHRVQRVPTTESQGRIQTSTATVAVLPEVEDVEVEIRTGKNGEQRNRLVIKDGEAFVETATCPDGICAAHKPISHEGESIICLPHRLEIRVEGGDGSGVDVK